MLVIFKRTVYNATESNGPQRVSAEIESRIDGHHHHIGQVSFPTKVSWTRFIGAVKRGAIGMTDMEVTIENVRPVEGQDANTK